MNCNQGEGGGACPYLAIDALQWKTNYVFRKIYCSNMSFQKLQGKKLNLLLFNGGKITRLSISNEIWLKRVLFDVIGTLR